MADLSVGHDRNFLIVCGRNKNLAARFTIVDLVVRFQKFNLVGHPGMLGFQLCHDFADGLEFPAADFAGFRVSSCTRK